MVKEIVICAAVKSECGKIIRGHRHSDCLSTGLRMGLQMNSKYDLQGFITSKNRFVSREDGRKIQDKAGIPSAAEDGYRSGVLFSEDLY